MSRSGVRFPFWEALPDFRVHVERQQKDRTGREFKWRRSRDLPRQMLCYPAVIDSNSYPRNILIFALVAPDSSPRVGKRAKHHFCSMSTLFFLVVHA